MKKFKIEIIKRTVCTLEVEADNTEDAIEIAQDLYLDSENYTYEIDSIEEV